MPVVLSRVLVFMLTKEAIPVFNEAFKDGDVSGLESNWRDVLGRSELAGVFAA